ncbi:helix-turn-helix domain-containing protein [Galbibacter pacificus]|uniref:Helix-turn-helix domain-containing protein n=1 Tax=Galbibacter pacificus TaxID=2996052 RepID=A0ABT6FNY3_9FLAO|nr:helix-turn-helix domain-containing protein [Galbibacter pacificus]MDG3581394.1 helix-turn-helix domain-containing protein [Galbibacter pacificus]MDG3584872.1 helix-turn-helix domain-containing protein [Galbibacter pacificus]
MSRTLSTYNSELKLKGFNVFQIEEDGNATKAYNRKDFYKICLTTGKSSIHYADRSFDAEGTILFFGNPNIPYAWETLSTQYVGYTILFSEDFYTLGKHSENLQKSPLFKMGGTPILDISEQRRQFLNSIFKKMIEEQQSDYEYKDDLIRNYIDLILHESLKLKPSENYNQDKNGSERLTNIFMELLERQFPVESPDRPLLLRTAKDYAKDLSVHVNYLNRAVKEVTGKTTTTHISERITNEAKAILQNTDWNVSEIAYALGFEYPTYFNNFFKKQAGVSPSAVRLEKV